MDYRKHLVYPSVIALLALTACRDGSDTVADPGGNGNVIFPQLAKVAVTVTDYSPAPGQFVNELPEYEDGDTDADMCRKAAAAINSEGLVTLGAFGGSITMELSEPISNLPGEPDFQVSGNAIPTSSEPGVVEVSPDGIVWYELRGEKWSESEPGFGVTYYLPEADASDAEYIRWTAASGATGWISRNSAYHTQPFFPQWRDGSQPLSLSARRLPSNGSMNPSTGQYSLSPYLGYADSYPNNIADSYLNLESAVDASGNSVDIKQIGFVRVTTGVLQNNGPLGECSTEISAIYRLHD